MLPQLSAFTHRICQELHGSNQHDCISFANIVDRTRDRIRRSQNEINKGFEPLLHRLPSNVLQLLIAFLVQEQVEKNNGSWNTSKATLALRTLAGTSNFLRCRLLSTPALWARIRAASFKENDAAWLQICLQRSDPVPIFLQILNLNLDPDTTLDCITKNLSRVASLDFQSCEMDQWKHVCNILIQEAPNLERLDLIQDGISNSRTLPCDLLSGNSGQLWDVSLTNVHLDAPPALYTALQNVTHLQYSYHGYMEANQIRNLLSAFPRLQRVGLAIRGWTGFDQEEEQPEPLRLPASVRDMVVPDVRGMMLTKLAAFLGRPQCLSFRPEDSQRHKSPYKEIPIQPYDRLISMHCAWRRAVAVFSSSPPDSDPSHLKEAADSADQRLLRLYARREDIARILRARPSADHLTLLTLGESAWVHLATTSEISPSSPLHLTGLACLEIFFQNCSTYGSNSMEIGLWPEVKLFAALHLPKLDILHLVHLIPIMHRGQCSSAVRERTLGHTMGRCWCRNSGIVAMEQVLDLLAHRAPGFDQLPQLILSGVSSIVDDDPPSTRARFESHVSEVLINADVADEQMQHINMHNRYYRHALTRRLPDYDYNNFWY